MNWAERGHSGFLLKRILRKGNKREAGRPGLRPLFVFRRVPNRPKTIAADVRVPGSWPSDSFRLLDYLASFAFAEADIFPSVIFLASPCLESLHSVEFTHQQCSPVPRFFPPNGLVKISKGT